MVLWDLQTPAEPVAVFTDVPRHTHEVAFSPDGRLLYTAAHDAPPVFESDPAIVVHDIETRAVVRTLDVPSYPFALSPDGTLIAVASAAPETADPSSGTDVLLIDATSGEPVHRLRGHTGPVTAVAFSPDGALLASGSGDRTIAVWDVATGDRVQLLEGHAGAVSGVVFGPDGDAALSASVDGAVLGWDLAGDRRFLSVRTTAGDLLERSSGGGVLDDVSLVSPTGDSIVSIVSRRDVRGRGQQDRSIGRIRRAYAQVIDAVGGRAGPAVDTGHGEFAAAAWHPDGDVFATAGEDGSVKLWDAGTMTVVAERQLPGVLAGVTYLGDGAELLVVGLNGVPVQRFDATTLEARSEPFTFLTGFIAMPYASADAGDVAIVTSSSKGVVVGNQRQINDHVLVVDAHSGEVRHEVDLGFDGGSAAVAPDSALVAVVGEGGQLGLVDLATGALVRPPATGHDGAVASVSYAPDGALIASGGSDGRVALWDGHTGDLRGTVRITSAGSRVFVGFAPGGETVTITTQDGRIHRLDVRPERWIEQACSIAGRNLTRGEWRDAFGARPYRASCPPS